MKKLILVTLTMIISVSSFGCSNKEVGQDISKEQFKRKFIIIDSVNEPLPPEAENVEYMPSDISGPQLIPNAKFSDPIIITKKPYSETNTWEEFNGYAIDSKTENNLKKILVVKGITQDEVVNKSVDEVMKKVPSKDMIWFTDKQISLEKIQIGDQVSVWWDAGKLHPEPAILTLPAENIEIDKILNCFNSIRGKALCLLN